MIIKMKVPVMLLLMTLIYISWKQQSSTGFDGKEIMAQLELNSQGKTEVVKNFPKSFPEVLISRGEPLVYTRENSNNFEYIGMPVGGIGAGQLYLGGDGQLWFWDIFGTNYCTGHLKGEEAYEFPYERSKPNQYGALQINQGFSVSTLVNGKEKTLTLNRDGFSDIKFIGQYPIGEVSYEDEDFPVKAKLEAFSPFIPLDLHNSMLPATILNFSLTNTSDKAIKVELKGWMENAVLNEGRKNTKIKGELVNSYTKTSAKIGRLECKVENTNATATHQLDYGTMSLSIVSEKGSINMPSESARATLTPEAELTGELASTLELEPGEEKQVSFVLSWHFPKTYKEVYHWGDGNMKWISDDSTNYYSEIYQDAFAVSDYVLNNWESLNTTTQLWRDTWYNSTLPYWFLDRTFLNTSILASSTSSILDGGMFYGTEGGNQGPGNCNHVWGYVQAPGRLFPELEKSLREMVDFKPASEGGSLKEDGALMCRWTGGRMAVDGQSGVILRTYLIHQTSKDDSFLKRNYKGAKKVMNGLIDLKDDNHDGILSGSQFNTLDASWYGEVTWLSLHYTTALRAMANMAEEVGDLSYATLCREIADKGRKYIEENLFNGEYFYHEADTSKPNTPGTYSGIEYSQLLGQSWAYQVGMGEIIDPVKARKALESLWRYNFTTDVGPFRKVMTGGRWYAMPGEGGLIACTWPRGGREVLAFGEKRYADYNNECQNGYEYAATSLMMWHGMPYHSLAHMWYMHNDRYHGSKRNPWCEIEWGLHYSRSMASYGSFIAVSGFEYHGPKGYMAFSPKITPHDFRSAFTAAEGWGTFEQTQGKSKQTNTLSLAHGKLSLKTLVLTMDAALEVKKLTASINDQILNCQYEQTDDQIHIVFDSELLINANEILMISIR